MTWAIGPEEENSQVEEKAHWKRSHRELDYSDVFSVTEDEGLRARIAGLLRDTVGEEDLRLLVPGCGSRALIERSLIRTFPTADVVATDLSPDAIATAKRRLADERVTFLVGDNRQLGFTNEFDAAIVINSILSGSDEDNRSMLRSISDALVGGGVLIGLFPTVFSAADIAFITDDPMWMNSINLKSSRFHEKSQRHRQIFYTPLRLNAILHECSFFRIRMEIFFCDSPTLRAEADRIYGLRGQHLVIYELLVTMRKIARLQRD